MTAIPADRVRLPRASARPIPLMRVTQVELRKMFDTRSGFWLIASIVITAVLATAGVILFAPAAEVTYSTFVSAIRFPMLVILPMVAILAVTGEWTQRSGLTTFTLVPHRYRVITAKAISSVAVGIVSVLLAFVIGALGNVLGTAITGTTQVWNVTLIEGFYYVFGNVLSLLMGFMLGVLIRASAGAIAAYFVYSFVLPTIFGLLAASVNWFRDLQPWVDVQFAQTALFTFAGTLSGAQWAHIVVTGMIWLVIPLAIGLGFVTRAEVK
jgi:ABC-2 type transport system permease protein